MEDWRKDYNRYMFKCAPQAEGLGAPHCVHHCPVCGKYLWADKNHMSYNYCVSCGKNLKGIKLPYERI